MGELKERAIRGGVAKICSQAATFLMRIGTLMVLARSLDPSDFGLVGMVTAVVGALYLFREFGLSTATVQRQHITPEQVSTLFWINVGVGTILVLICLAAAPFIATFYHEPRLVAVTIAVGSGLLFTAIGVQHSALLQREMRFTALAVVEATALAVSSVVGVVMALSGYGYWALVMMTAILPLASTIGVWLCSGWIPRRPHRGVGLKSMMRFGGTVTLNGIVVYVAYNIEKVMMGRFWGAETVGIYGRAYQLITLPNDNLNSAVGGVAFAALSRLRDDAGRLNEYFLKGYSLVLAVTLPATIFCAICADDLVLVVLGPKWREAAAIFRLLAPAVLVQASINPLYWLLVSLGLVERSLKMAFVIAPLVIASYFVGFQYGPKGVAFCYSAAMTLWLVPHLAWSVYGTPLSLRQIILTVGRPLISGLVAAAVTLGIQLAVGSLLSPPYRLAVDATGFLCAYAVMVLYVMGQKAIYLDIVRGIRSRSPIQEKTLIPA